MQEPGTAVELALSALRSRDRSWAELEDRLRERGMAANERHETLESLVRSGYVDDERLAHARAAALAERSSGDLLIRADLAGRGIDPELVERALARLEPERLRAGRVLARRGGGPRAARYLASRGFGEETLEAVVIAQDGGGEVG